MRPVSNLIHPRTILQMNSVSNISEFSILKDQKIVFFSNFLQFLNKFFAKISNNIHMGLKNANMRTNFLSQIQNFLSHIKVRSHTQICLLIQHNLIKLFQQYIISSLQSIFEFPLINFLLLIFLAFFFRIFNHFTLISFNIIHNSVYNLLVDSVFFL